MRVPHKRQMNAKILPNHAKEPDDTVQRLCSRLTVSHVKWSAKLSIRNDQRAANLRAINPASVQMALMSAPERSSLALMYSSMLTSSARVMRLVWMLKMRRRVLSSGSGNSILRSIRPGRMSAGSRLSMRLVAMITFTSPRESNPSSWEQITRVII